MTERSESLVGKRAYVVSDGRVVGQVYVASSALSKEGFKNYYRVNLNLDQFARLKDSHDPESGDYRVFRMAAFGNITEVRLTVREDDLFLNIEDAKRAAFLRCLKGEKDE